MEPSEIDELIETRPNEAIVDDITQSLSLPIAANGGEERIDLRIEYKPANRCLADGAISYLVTRGLFETPSAIEGVVSDLYWGLVNSLFPKQTYLDEPWTTLPLVVEVEYMAEGSERVVSLGEYR